MKKVLFAVCSLLFITAADSNAALIITYEGQSKLTPILAGNNLWRLDCLSAEKACCTVNWDHGTVDVHALVHEPGQPATTPIGEYHGTIDPATFIEHPNEEISVEIN